MEYWELELEEERCLVYALEHDLAFLFNAIIFWGDKPCAPPKLKDAKAIAVEPEELHTVIRSTISGYPPLFTKRNSNSSDVRVFVFRLKEFASNLQSMDTSYVIRKLSWWNVNLRRCEDRKT